jgi:hypothetical protein
MQLSGTPVRLPVGKLMASFGEWSSYLKYDAAACTPFAPASVGWTYAMGYTMQSAVAVTTAVQVPRVGCQGCSLVQDIGDGQRALPGMFMVTNLAGCSDLLLASNQL